MSEPHSASAEDGVYGSGRRLLTLDEVAEQLGSSVDQVQELVDARSIPFSRRDNRLRFDSAALSLWLETRH